MSQGFWVLKFVESLSHRKNPGDPEQENRHHKRPEELLFAMAKRVEFIRGLLAFIETVEKKKLVECIGCGVISLSKHGCRTAEKCGDILAQSDSQIPEQCGDNGFFTSFLHYPVADYSIKKTSSFSTIRW